MVIIDVEKADLDFIRNLITALRSGKYEQTNHILRKDDKYCCLGVACDIYDEGEWVGDAYTIKDGDISYSSKECAVYPIEKAFGVDHLQYGSISEIPVSKSSIQKAGVEFNKGYVTAYKKPFTYLTSLNDGGVSFKEIADILEHEYFNGNMNDEE